MQNHFPGADKRKSLRLDMESELVGLAWRNKEGQLIKRQVMCIDVSNGGLKVNIDRRIETDDFVEVTFKDKQGGTNTKLAKVLRETEEHGWFDVAMFFIEQPKE